MARSERAVATEGSAAEEEKVGLLAEAEVAEQPQGPVQPQQLPGPSNQAPIVGRSSSMLKAQPSDASAPTKETGICRICLEEDVVSALETPCKCSGTQRHAHHACIQRWVDEKGNAKCEICEQPYGPPGRYTVPPAPAMQLENMPLFTPMYILEASDPRNGHRGTLDLLDQDHTMQRNPSVSWCITFIVFFMFLVVLHHTLIIADGMDDDGTMGPGGSAPAPGAPMSDDPNDDVASNLLLFLFWVATKAFLIGIPLYTVMRVASRQARREQYEAMMRAGTSYDANRRMVIRVRGADQPLATAV